MQKTGGPNRGRPFFCYDSVLMYNVKLCSIPLPRPFSLAVHTFFLLSDGTTENRFEVWWEKDTSHPDALYLQKDFYDDPLIGGRKTIFESIYAPKHFFQTEVLATVTGEVGSVAESLYSTIMNSFTTYPGRNRYRLLPGPNSNTYVQWAINQVPGCNFTLPWNAFGKGFANTLQ